MRRETKIRFYALMYGGSRKTIRKIIWRERWLTVRKWVAGAVIATIVLM